MNNPHQFLSPKSAARLAFVKESAVYKAIRKQKMPVLEERMMGTRVLKIPVEPFLKWLEFYIQRHEVQARMLDTKLRNLKLSYQNLKEHLKIS